MVCTSTDGMQYRSARVGHILARSQTTARPTYTPPRRKEEPVQRITPYGLLQIVHTCECIFRARICTAFQSSSNPLAHPAPTQRPTPASHKPHTSSQRRASLLAARAWLHLPTALEALGHHCVAEEEPTASALLGHRQPTAATSRHRHHLDPPAPAL